MYSITEIKQRFEAEIASDRPLKTAADLPRCFEEINKDWLTSIVCADSDGAEVVDFQLGPPDEGTSNRRAITIDYNAAGEAQGLPAKVFCKASHSLQSRFVIGNNRAAQTEVDFYNHIRQRLDIEAPKSVFANGNPETLNSFIMLEDMADEVVFCDETTAISRTQIESQIALLAKLHGRYYQSDALDNELAEFHSMKQFFESTQVAFDWREAAANGVLAAEPVIPAALFSRRDEIWALTEQAFYQHQHLPNTLVHNDVHLKNWYVAASGKMGLSDWQCMVKGHWCRDLAYTIATALTVDDRRAWEQELIALYLNLLAQQDVETPDFEQTLLWYRQQLLTALAMWTATLTPPEGSPDMQPAETSLVFIERMANAIVDLKSLDAFAG